MAIAKGLQKLEFNRQIVSSVEDVLSTKDLISNLSDLHNKLSALDQEDIDLSSLESVKNDLINKKLVKHKNPGVQIYVACCLSDILRIYAPDAPYNASQLSDLFKLFFHQFQYLTDVENGYHHQYIYLLTRLAEVRSIVLITDLPNSDKLIETLFQIFYDLAIKSSSKSTRSEQTLFNERLEPLICDILSEVITESPSIPLETLKLILNRFLANTKVMKTNPSSKKFTSVPGFNFSLNICKLNADRMARLITQVFSEVIYEGEKEDKENRDIGYDDDSEDESDDDDYNDFSGVKSQKKRNLQSSSTLEQLKKLHTLSIELWKYVPEVLASVMGLTEDELEADDERIRASATETIGEILAIKPSKLNFVTVHQSTYISWMKRPFDKSPFVRIAWVKTTSKILKARNDIASDITNRLAKTLVDNDERTRLTTCKEFSTIPVDIFISNVANESIMNTLSQLTREKNAEIRSANLNFLGNLYNLSFDLLYKGDPIVDKLIGWIPQTILNLVYINDKSINAQVNFIVIEKLLLYSNTSPSKRVHRLLTLIGHLDEKSKRSFLSIVKKQQTFADALYQCIKISISYDGGKCESPEVLRSKIENVVTWFSATMPSEFNPDTCLKHFFLLNNRRFFQLVQMCTSSDANYRTIENSIKELLSRLQDPSNYKIDNSPISFTSSEMTNTIKLLLYRSAVFIFNKDIIAEILKINNETSNPLNQTAQEALQQISSIIPGVLKSNISQMIQSITNYTDSSNKSGKKNISKDLKTVYHFFKSFPDSEQIKKSQDEKKYNSSLKEIILKGTPSESKYAIRILNLTNLKEDVFDDIIHTVWPLNIDSPNFNTHLSIIAELFSLNPMVMEDKSLELSSLLASQVLLKNRTVGKTNEDGTELIEDVDVWISDEELETAPEYKDCNSKVAALRIYVNWLIAVKDDSNHEKVAEPIFKLLTSLVGNGGELLSSKAETWPTPREYQSRLRLEAGLKLLKLAKFPEYNILIQPQLITRLVLLVQDENEKVRVTFSDKLKKYLTLNTISERFLPLFYFFAHEPNLSLKNDCRTWVRSIFCRHLQDTTTAHSSESTTSLSSSKLIKFEKSFVRFLHMLAHHQEFLELVEEISVSSDKDKATLKVCDFALTYITFALDLIATSENISLIYYLTSRIKQYHDALSPEKSENLYIISDLTQLKIKSLTTSRNWNLATWPGKLSLSADLFSSNKNAKELHAVAVHSYIPESIHKNVVDLIKDHNRSVTQDEKENVPKKKATKPARVIEKHVIVSSSNSKSKKTNTSKRRKVVSSDDEDEIDESVNDEDDNDENDEDVSVMDEVTSSPPSSHTAGAEEDDEEEEVASSSRPRRNIKRVKYNR